MDEVINILQAEEENLVIDADSIRKLAALEKQKSTGILVKIVTLIGAGLAALAFTGFLFVAGLVESHHFLIFLGLVFIAAGVFLPTFTFRWAIAEPFALAIFIEGFVVAAIGWFGLSESYHDIFIPGIVVSLITLEISKSSIQRFAAVLIFWSSISGQLIDLYDDKLITILAGFLGVTEVLLIIKEPVILGKYKKLIRFYHPVLFGNMFTMLVLIAINKAFVSEIYYLKYAASIILIGGIAYLLNKIIADFNLVWNKYFVMIAVMVVLLATVPAPGISASILILLSGIYVNKVEMKIIGLAGLAYFTGMFYYDLETSLLLKSILLFITGLLFIGIYYFIAKKVFDGK